MDRSADGGMAPALQSSNHQSTSLVNQETEATRVEDILPHKAVNGNAYEDVTCKKTLNDAESSTPLADAAGDAASDKITTTAPNTNAAQSCILSGLKEALPTVSLPMMHLGQGDSTVTTNHNGWGDCKRPHTTSVLQESNNLSDNVSAIKGLSKSSLVEKTMDSKNATFKKEDENQPNGKIRTAFRSKEFQRSMNSTVGTEAETLYSQSLKSDGTKSIVTARCGVEATDSPNTLENDGSREGENHMHEDWGKDNDVTSFPHAELNKMQLTEPNLPEALNYAELLSSDLSKINMSDKLANTLQELAASLKATAMPLDMGPKSEGLESPKLRHTVNLCRSGSLHRSTRSLDFSTNEPTDKDTVAVEQKRIIESKVKSAVEGAGILDYRLNILKRNIDAVRSRQVKLHLKRELRDITSQKFLQRINSDEATKNISHLGEASNVSSEFWRKLFVHRSRQTEKQFIDQFGASMSGRKRSELAGKVNNNYTLPPQESVNKDPTLSDERVPGDITGIDLDPYVQLTRVEHMTTHLDGDKQKLLQQAKVNTGVLYKELKYVSSRCDPDLTESSSDEDVTDTATEKLSRFKTSKVNRTKPSNRKFHKSFCKWVAERAEIARKWTWLQSRISSLEFNIRQQGELYAHLRGSKGAVQLEEERHFDGESRIGASMSNNERESVDSVSTPVPVSTSPCNVNLLVDNIHHQTSKLFDELSPLSGGSPPNQSIVRTSSQSVPCSIFSSKSVSTPICASHSRGKSEMCARTRQLCLSTFQNRHLVKLTPLNLTSSKMSMSKIVPNDSSIMCVSHKSVCRTSINDQVASAILKAALHDHSYHAVISSTNDIPLSISMRAVMKSKRKWCRKHGTKDKSSQVKRDGEKSKKHKHKKKSKHKLQKKNKRSFSVVAPNHLDDVSESKRRKLGSQVSDSSRKGFRGASFDSDLDSSVVIGGFNAHLPSGSGTTTPTSEIAGQNQNYWKKKKSSEQAYDINNIIIPHGLNSARIEKLPYKEIQTPSWKILELGPIKEEQEKALAEDQKLDVEDTSCTSFQRRHDTYEIAEKRKYMAFMEWSISRKGRGSRMSNIRGPSTPEPVSPSSLRYTPSPVAFSGEPFPSNTVPGNVSSNVTTSPTAKTAGVTTRRMSSEQTPARPGTPPSHLHQNQRNIDTSLNHSYSSPSYSAWQDGLGIRRGSQDSVSSVNRTLSEGGNGHAQMHSRMWEIRTFPLSVEDMRALDDADYARQKLIGGSEDLQHLSNETEEGMKHHNMIRQSSGEKLNQTSDYTRTFSQDSFHEHHKSGMFKRRRTDSRASSLASHDDAARYSDASNTSASSARRRHKKGSSNRLHFSHHKKEHGSEKDSVKTARNIRSKHTYLHIRLSETDDSSSDSDSDSHTSDQDTSTSFDDAGHVVDDYADPEWEAPAHRHRDRR